MPREQTVNPLGLITRPNKFGQYPPGALSTCRNVVLRDKGVITSMPANAVYRSSVLGVGNIIRRMFSAVSSLLVIGDNAGGGTWTAEWVTASSNTAITEAPPEYPVTPPTFTAGKLQMSKARDRYFITTDTSPLMFDSEGDTTTRAVGFPGVSIRSDLGTAANAVAFLDGKVASWKAVWRRVHSDGYETTSEPSAGVLLENASTVTLDMTWSIKIGTAPYDIIAGDIIDLYRTKQVASGSDPGGTYYLAQSHVVTAAEVIALATTVKDSTPDDSLGPELYSNPGRPVPPIVGVGGAYINTPPAVAPDTFVFNGQTFYNEVSLASFFAFKFTTYFGYLSSVAERTTGIGTRTFTGTSAIGSAVITGTSDTSGIVQGQMLSDTGGKFGASVTVVSKTANTVTMNTVATGAGATTFAVADVWEVDGVAMRVGSGYDLTNALNRFNIQSEFAFNAGKLVAGPVLDTTQIVDGFSVVIRKARAYAGALTLRVTNAQNYSPNLTEYTATAANGSTDPRPNRLKWSKPQQPEACPPQQELQYGAGTHYRGIPTDDCVWLFASDGLWRLSGNQDEYRVDPRDNKLILAGRNAVATLGSTVYAYTERGLVRITADGAIDDAFARDAIGDLIPGAAYADTWATFVTADEVHREIWLTFQSGATTLSYVYSEITGAFWTDDHLAWTAIAYAPYARQLVLGYGQGGGSAPNTEIVNADSSSSRATLALLAFQPLTGDGNPFTLKQFTDVDFIFDGVSVELIMTPQYDGTAVTPNVRAPVSSIESRARSGVPQSAAIANTLRPGVNLNGNLTGAWRFLGLSARYTRLSEETGTR